jgi:hypothetical protein
MGNCGPAAPLVPLQEHEVASGSLVAGHLWVGRQAVTGASRSQGLAGEWALEGVEGSCDTDRRPTARDDEGAWAALSMTGTPSTLHRIPTGSRLRRSLPWTSMRPDGRHSAVRAAG